MNESLPPGPRPTAMSGEVECQLELGWLPVAQLDGRAAATRADLQVRPVGGPDHDRGRDRGGTRDAWRSRRRSRSPLRGDRDPAGRPSRSRRPASSPALADNDQVPPGTTCSASVPAEVLEREHEPRRVGWRPGAEAAPRR